MVVSQETRDRIRAEQAQIRQKLDQFMNNINRQREQLTTQRALRNTPRYERIKKFNALITEEQKANPLRQRYDYLQGFANQPTPQEEERRIRKAFDQARAAIRRGVPTQFLTGEVKRIAGQIRRGNIEQIKEAVNYAKRTNQTYSISGNSITLSQKPQKVNAPILRSTDQTRSTNNSTSMFFQSAEKKKRSNWYSWL